MDLSQITENSFFVRYKYFLLPVLALSIGLILLTFVIIPQFFSSLSTEKKLLEVKTQNEKLIQKLQILTQVDEESYRQNINIVLTAIPPDQDVPSAIGQILYLINVSTLRLSSVGVSVGTNAKESYQLRLEVEGDISALREFSDKLKTSPRIMKITGLEFNKIRGGDVQATIEILTYFKPISSTIGSIDQSINPITDQEAEIIKQINSYSKTVPVITSATISGPKGKTDPFE